MKTITLPAETEHLYLDDVADLIACALWPASEVRYKLALDYLKPELEQAATDGSLRTRHPVTLGFIPPAVQVLTGANWSPLANIDTLLDSRPPIVPLHLRVVTVPDFTSYVAARGMAVVMEAPEQTPQPQAAPAQHTPTSAPSAVEHEEVIAKAAPTGPRLSTNKAALVAQHKHEWPTIERDIKDASENGLSRAAKAGPRDWNEEDAIQWARSKNKLIQPTSAATLNSVMNNLPSKIHRLEG